MKNLGIQNSILSEIIPNNSKYKNYTLLSDIIKNTLSNFNTPFVDPCCPLNNDLKFPVGINSEGDLQKYDGTAWVTLPVSGSGETNTMSNLGAGEGTIFSSKSGVDLRLKSLKAGTNITITQNANEITLNASGGGTPSLTSTRIAFGDVSNLMTSSSKLVFNDSLYPTMVITGNDPLIYLGASGTLTNNPSFGSGAGAAIYGGAAYKSIQFVDQISGGVQMARFYNSGGTILHDFLGRITTTTTVTAGTNLGAYNIDRTFAELSSGPNQHGYVDKSIFRYGAGALNSFYSEVTAGTTNAGYTQNHIAHFQSLLVKDGANTLNIQYDFVALASLLNGGTLGNRYGFYMFDANPAGGGTLTNQYGIYIPTLTAGTKKNVGIYSGSVVSIGTNTPSLSALLQVDSTTKGFLPPRMTGTQAEAIVTPAEGLIVYSTDGSGTTITSKGWWGYDGATWLKIN